MIKNMHPPAHTRKLGWLLTKIYWFSQFKADKGTHSSAFLNENFKFTLQDLGELVRSTYSSPVILKFQFLRSGLYLNSHYKFPLKAYFGEQKGTHTISMIG